MTYTEEFIPGDLEQEIQESPTYPTAFGITFTPMIGGAIMAVVGLIGAGYLFANTVLPNFQSNQELQAKLDETEAQIQQRQGSQQKINESQQKLELAKRQKQEVLALFAKEKTLNTLLLDINGFINARQGSLQGFEPEKLDPIASVIKDGSLGANLDNKVKRQGATVSLEGSFDQIQSILRSIERLEQLLLIRDFKAELDKSTQKVRVDSQGKIIPQAKPTTNITTTFKVNALVPLTPEEAAAAALQPKK
ncbi:MAG: pilus assembly protein [Crinalium sp.]